MIGEHRPYILYILHSILLYKSYYAQTLLNADMLSAFCLPTIQYTKHHYVPQYLI